MHVTGSRALYRLETFLPEQGAAYQVILPEELADGDTNDQPHRSRLELLEDGFRLGPAHVEHAEIRTIGAGLFSHWGQTLYFSTSDNSDPRENGRSYFAYIPLGGPDPGTSVALHDAIRQAALQSETEIQTILCAQLVAIAGAAIPKFQFGHVLEIGGYGHPGLAFLLLLLGAKRVTLNNRKPIRNWFSATYVENLLCLVSQNPAISRNWRRVITKNDGGYSIRPEFLGLAAQLDAGEIHLDEPADFIFSLSVLEHIRHLPGVLGHLRTLLRPGGFTYHWIDVRDHTSFADPLVFLRLSPAEFAERYSDENNRWRPSDYLRMLEQAGFSTLSTQFLAENPLAETGTDVLWFIREGMQTSLWQSIDEVNPVWVTEEVRRSLHPHFQSFSLKELSVVGLGILSR